MDPKSLAGLKAVFKGALKENEPLKNHCWYQIGGPADLFADPNDQQDLSEILRYCRISNIPFFVLGNGSNILISDSGFRGIVISLKKGFSSAEILDTTVKAGAGMIVPRLVMQCEKAGLQGIETLAGVPGTVGGAVKMNAGAHGTEIFDCIASVSFLEGERVKTAAKKEIRYAYRHVPTFDSPDRVILSAELTLQRGDRREIEQRRKRFLKIRQQTQPINLPCSGSTFKNPPGNYAGKLIEEAGLKGLRVGNASVSDKHGNFIVNEGGARAEDVLEIIRKIRETVKTRFGVSLELEIMLVGFGENFS